jgi:hypothetical protein
MRSWARLGAVDDLSDLRRARDERVVERVVERGAEREADLGRGFGSSPALPK